MVHSRCCGVCVANVVPFPAAAWSKCKSVFFIRGYFFYTHERSVAFRYRSYSVSNVYSRKCLLFYCLLLCLPVTQCLRSRELYRMLVFTVLSALEQNLMHAFVSWRVARVLQWAKSHNLAIKYFCAIWLSLAQALLNCLLASFVMVLTVVEKGSMCT